MANFVIKVCTAQQLTDCSTACKGVGCDLLSGFSCQGTGELAHYTPSRSMSGAPMGRPATCVPCQPPGAARHGPRSAPPLPADPAAAPRSPRSQSAGAHSTSASARGNASHSMLQCALQGACLGVRKTLRQEALKHVRAQQRAQDAQLLLCGQRALCARLHRPRQPLLLVPEQTGAHNCQAPVLA